MRLNSKIVEEILAFPCLACNQPGGKLCQVPPQVCGVFTVVLIHLIRHSSWEINNLIRWNESIGLPVTHLVELIGKPPIDITRGSEGSPYIMGEDPRICFEVPHEMLPQLGFSTLRRHGTENDPGFNPGTLVVLKARPRTDKSLNVTFDGDRINSNF